MKKSEMSGDSPLTSRILRSLSVKQKKSVSSVSSVEKICIFAAENENTQPKTINY